MLMLPTMKVSSLKKTKKNCYLLHAGFLLGSVFNPEDGGNMFL
jgi:hypothetical protein